MASVVAPRSLPRSAWIWKPSPSMPTLPSLRSPTPRREGLLRCRWPAELVAEMMAVDVERICGPRGKHDADPAAYHHGTEERLVPVSRALVKTDRPQVGTTKGREVSLPSWELVSSRDMLGETAVGRMLAGRPAAATKLAPSRCERSSCTPPARRSPGASAGRPRRSSRRFSARTCPTWTCSRCSLTGCTSERT